MKNYNEIIRSVAPLAVVLILTAFIAQFTINKVSSQNVQITKLKKDNTTLSQKVRVLGSVSATVADDANTALLALPATNSSLAVISQLKNKALENGIIMGNLKAGGEVKDNSGLSRVDIAIELDGPKTQIISYLNSLSTIAPLVIVDKVKLSEANSVTRANVTVKAFWTALPKTLPTITQNLTDLTEKENEILLEIADLTPPQFSGISESGASSGREDPFTQ